MASPDDPDTIIVLDQGRTIELAHADATRYHGPGSPGGLALAYRAMQRGLPLVAPNGVPERREVDVRTAFGGPGARDAFELVLRAVSGDRYVVDAALERGDLAATRARFVFRLSYRGRVATLVLREGFVTPDFIEMLAIDGRSAEQEARLTELKEELAARVMAASPDDVFDAGA